MADNYLEKRMDDYRNGRLSIRRHTNSSNVRNIIPDPDSTKALSGSRVFLITPSASGSERAVALIKLLCSSGCKVAFTDIDSKAGNLLAQTTGAQCHPIDISDLQALARSRNLIASRWGGIDITIEL